MSADTFGMICLLFAAAFGIAATVIDERQPSSFYSLATRFDFKRPAPRKSEFSLRAFLATTAIALVFGWLFINDLANDSYSHAPAEFAREIRGGGVQGRTSICGTSFSPA